MMMRTLPWPMLNSTVQFIEPPQVLIEQSSSSGSDTGMLELNERTTNEAAIEGMLRFTSRISNKGEEIVSSGPWLRSSGKLDIWPLEGGNFYMH